MKTLKMLGALAALLPAAALAQMMMGNPVATAPYFPLVDGACYEYQFDGGPWSSSRVTVTGGQSWAGMAGLFAMHSTYQCAAGVTCAPDATDFYGMDNLGMHYYGGTGADATGTHFGMTSLTSPEWTLMGTVYPGTMMGGGMYANAGTWTTSVQGSGSMMGARGYLSRYAAQALEKVTVPAGTFANALHVREQRGDGVVRDVWYAPGVGMVRVDQDGHSMVLTGYTMPGAATQPGGGAAALPFLPMDGLWWNPAESGTGYNLQVRHGVMVVTMFSYAASGEPLWYYASGRLAASGAGVAMGGTLDRYRGGQCASCAYAAPTAAGSDGAFSIAFDSPSTATVTLPGGRTTRIQPQPW